jgi:hypothetical protein
MNILGIGKTGCLVADKFSAYPQYEVYKIGTQIETNSNCYRIGEYTNPEHYDNTPINPNFSIDGDLDVILGGDDLSIACTLRVLENYKDCSIRIFYIKPNYKFLSDTQKTVDKIVYNVLQEYTRSNRFQSMYIFEYENIIKTIGKVPLTQVQSKIGETICSTIHMVNFLDHNEPVMSNYQETPVTYCINSIGIMDFDNAEEKKFYELDNVREKRYYYCINEKQLDTDGDLFDLINKQIDSKIEENTSIMYGVYPTQFEQNYCYVVYKSPYIQK